MAIQSCVHRASIRPSFRPSVLTSVTRQASVVCFAKKGKKGKKGGNKKGGSLLGDLAKTPQIQPWQTTDIVMQHLLMVESYRCDIECFASQAQLRVQSALPSHSEVQTDSPQLQAKRASIMRKMLHVDRKASLQATVSAIRFCKGCEAHTSCACCGGT
jgi:hypothetical protein